MEGFRPCDPDHLGSLQSSQVIHSTEVRRPWRCRDNSKMVGSQHEMVDFMDLMVMYGYMVYRYSLMDLRHGYYSLNAGLNGYKLFGLVLFGTMVLAPNSGFFQTGLPGDFFKHTNVQKQKVSMEAISIDEPRSLAKLKSASALSVGKKGSG